MPSPKAKNKHTTTAIPAYLRRGGCLLMLAVAVAAPLAGVQFGALDPCDESYQALCVGSYSCQPSAPAIFAAGHLWQWLFGHDALTLRYLGVICVLAAIAIGALWYYRRRGNALEACALMAAASLTATPAIFRIYNWDTGAYPVEALSLVAALSLWLRPRMWKTALLGALCALAFLSRVQLAIYLPLALWLAAAALPRRRRAAAALTLGAFTAVWAAGALVIFGSPLGHAEAIISGNFISGHTLDNWRYLLRRARLDTIDLPLAWLPLGAAAAAAAVFHRYRSPRPWLRSALAVLLCGWIFLAAAITVTFYDGIIFAADLPLFIIVAILPAAMHCRPMPAAAIWICVISVALTAFGSDAIAERYFSSYALAPLVAVVLPALRRGGRRLLWTLIAFAATAGACTSAMRHIALARVYTHAMDRFPLQRGLLGSRRDLMSWSAMQAETDMRAGKRIKFVCRPYGLLLSYGKESYDWAELQNFHFKDGDATPEYDNAGAPLYDAYIFTLATPENMPLTMRQFSEAGYTLAPQSEASLNGEYFILESHEANN